MKFSDEFKISRDESEDWFDPVLSIDTPLFIDPFLIFRQEEAFFNGSHKEIIDFFNANFELIAQSGGNPRSPLYLKAVNSLQFPEVSELCLGYTATGTRGSGSSLVLANIIANALWEAIQAGITHIKHFEEITIIREGFGADRISDMTAGIIRNRLAQYTKAKCLKYGIPLAKRPYRRGIYNPAHRAWERIDFDLPFNRWNERPILLVPDKYLRELPTMNAHSFWDYCYSNENALLRREFSDDVSRNVDKATIVGFARRHARLRSDYQRYLEEQPVSPYDITKDEGGLLAWYDASAQFCKAYPLNIILKSPKDFTILIEAMIKAFAHYVEENQGWKLLWNDDKTPRSEKASQLLFLGIVKHYCKANNIDVSPEANIGRGPVDFKISQGYKNRTILELKLARNSKFWNGLKSQLPTYLKAESTSDGYFIVILYTNADVERISGIQQIADEFGKRTGTKMSVFIINAIPEKPSASKVTP
jgi:hypothetical protein